MFLLLKTSTTQCDVSQQDIPVLITNAALPGAVSNVPQMPFNSAVGHFSPPVFMSPTFPPPIGPYISLPPETCYPVQHCPAAAETGSVQTPACHVQMVSEHCSGRHSGRFVYDSQASVEEERVQQMTDDRLSPDRLDDTSYRDKVLDDDMSRERFERRLMKEKVEQWRIRDGIDSDRVEFERLRTPHRNVMDNGIFRHYVCVLFSFVC